MAYKVFQKKSLENLKASEILFDNACVNRCYYSMFHIALAILLKKIPDFIKLEKDKTPLIRMS